MEEQVKQVPKKKKKRGGGMREGLFKDLAAQLTYSPDHEDRPFKVGLAYFQELAKDQPVYLVRRTDPAKVRQGRTLLGRVLRRVAWDEVQRKSLVPGVTVYAARANLKDGPTLVIVDPVGRDWRRN